MNIFKKWLLIRENKKVIKKLDAKRLECYMAADLLRCQTDFIQRRQEE